MSSQFHQLLDATIEYLEGLKARGVRFVPAAPEALAALSGTARSAGRPAVAARPGPPAPSMPEEPPLPSGPEAVAELFALAAPAVNPAVPRPQSLSPAAKTQAMAELCERARVCVKCEHLAASRKNVVFGVGDINA